MTRAISHGCKRFNNFYRGPDCETAERGRLDSREESLSFLRRSSNYLVTEE